MLFRSTVQYQTPFKQVEEFLDKADIRDYYEHYRSQGQALKFEQVMDWLGEYADEQKIQEKGESLEGETLEIYPNGQYITRSSQMVEVERQASIAYQTAKELLLRAAGVL